MLAWGCADGQYQDRTVPCEHNEVDNILVSVRANPREQVGRKPPLASLRLPVLISNDLHSTALHIMGECSLASGLHYTTSHGGRGYLRSAGTAPL